MVPKQQLAATAGTAMSHRPLNSGEAIFDSRLNNPFFWCWEVLSPLKSNVGKLTFINRSLTYARLRRRRQVALTIILITSYIQLI